MARPRKKIDKDLVRKLAGIQCTNEEIAAVLNCSADTLERRFAGVIKEGRANGRQSLKRAQYKKAMEGNPTMLIWLGKQFLGQRDQPENLDPMSSKDSGKFVINFTGDRPKKISN